jgi:pRiA4b ORF-3-like protein
VERILSELDGPITVTDLADRVYAIYPTRSKTAMSSFRNCLHYDEQGVNLVYLDRFTILPTRIAMQGVRFRVPIDRHAEKENEIPVLFFDYFIGRDLEPKNIRFVDQTGTPIAYKIKPVKNIWEVISFWRRDFVDVFDFSAWFNKIKPRRGDSFLVAIRDWDSKEFILEHEEKKKRRSAEVQRYNKEFSDILFDMLEESRDGDIFLHQVIPDVFVRLSNPRGYPGDSWREIIENDKRMMSDGVALRYPENMSPFDHLMLPEDEQLPWIRDSYSRKQSNEVYRFKVSLGFDSPIWRVIEIKAGQTFADLDVAIRDAFGHDRYDHMGGFWQMIPRGKSQKKFREIEIGDINPLEEGTAADVHIGGMNLKPGDLIKYVYDFGDWVEHEVRLEKISAAEAGKSYPALVGRNKPKYQNCVVCESKGKETIATLVCLQCSNQKRVIFLCEDCAGKKHAEHYVEEIVY